MPVSLLPLLFIGIGVIFLGVALRGRRTGTERSSPARRAWLRVGFIFIAVGIVLAAVAALLR